MTQHHPPIVRDGWVVPFMTTIKVDGRSMVTGTGYGYDGDSYGDGGDGYGNGYGKGNGNGYGGDGHGDGDGYGYGDGSGVFARRADDPLQALTTL